MSDRLNTDDRPTVCPACCGCLLDEFPDKVQQGSLCPACDDDILNPEAEENRKREEWHRANRQEAS